MVSGARSPQSQYFKKRASIPPPPTLHPPIIRHRVHRQSSTLHSRPFRRHGLYREADLLHVVENNGWRSAFRLAEAHTSTSRPGRPLLPTYEHIPSSPSLCSASFDVQLIRISLHRQYPQWSCFVAEWRSWE
ncbi:hypothetical protein DFP72DRAFT_1175631 [Ephemerocybe angulata]|uniref:Uncharacterized protein n=1 Tax=Ephemerocybe angulata TaxID=980116 RepID=A0A8H6HG53_9AGAR|nr:hypothetical protein DFP72DRAFT_1175631 [Tulosesus angulatus]